MPQILTENQAATVQAILVWLDEQTGYWDQLSAIMRDDFGIDDPDAAIAELQDAVSG